MGRELTPVAISLNSQIIIDQSIIRLGLGLGFCGGGRHGLPYHGSIQIIILYVCATQLARDYDLNLHFPACHILHGLQGSFSNLN
jgi:hypothetical protein